MKTKLLIALLSLMLIRCFPPQSSTVILDNGQVIKVVDNHDLYTFNDTIVIKFFNNEPEIYGLYFGNEHLPDPLIKQYINRNNDTTYYTVHYRKGVFKQTMDHGKR